MSAAGSAVREPHAPAAPGSAGTQLERLLLGALAEAAGAERATPQQLRPLLAVRLAARFTVRRNDPVVPLPIAMWRPVGLPVTGPRRRMNRVDFVLRRRGRLCGLVAVVADLADLRPCARGRRTVRQTVCSLARAADGRPFFSCQPLERLAVAAYAWARLRSPHTSLDAETLFTADTSHRLADTSRRTAHASLGAETLRAELLALRSDAPADHNPAGLALVLVAARAGRAGAALLAPRLASLGARLLCPLPPHPNHARAVSSVSSVFSVPSVSSVSSSPPTPSRPMPTHYLNGHDTEARLNGRLVEVSRLDPAKNDVVTLNVPLFDIERVVIVGRPVVTLPLLERLAREGIPIHLVAGHGRWLGGFYPAVNGHALRRLRQYDLARDSAFALDMVRRLIVAKLRNSRRVLQRLAANREQSALPEQLDACNSIQALAARAAAADSIPSLRGIEGMGSALYFRRLSSFFPEDAPFDGRSRRPPRDPANALLSWTYTIALSEIDAAVRCAGLDPCLGFLHDISYGRPSLSLDLLEPLRAPVGDLLVLQILNHQMLKPADFETDEADGGIRLGRTARRTFFVEYEKCMTRRFSPQKGAAHTDFRAVIREQVNTLLRAMERRGTGDFFLMP
jgi:CRISPR-associated protein Cas1